MNRMLLLVFVILLIGCKEETLTDVHETVIVELYNVKESEKDFSMDTLQFKESYLFNKAGVEIGHHFFNNKNELVFKDIYEFQSPGTLPIGSKYYDKNDSLLSYYKYRWNELGQKIESRAFDASNDELIRIEEYEYDKNGFLRLKKIMTPTLELVRSQEFVNDDSGNELKTIILNSDNQPIFVEDYKITEQNEDNKWTKKWGFVNEFPFSYRKRTYLR